MGPMVALNISTRMLSNECNLQECGNPTELQLPGILSWLNAE